MANIFDMSNFFDIMYLTNQALEPILRLRRKPHVYAVQSLFP